MPRGLLIVHSVTRALAPHIEWAAAGVLGVPVKVRWEAQPMHSSLVRAEISWQGPTGTGARLATALRGWDELRFEITQNASEREGGSRWMYTPDLGIHHSGMDNAGNITLTEDRIRHCMETAGSNAALMQQELGKALGQPWDNELEIYREAALTGAIPRRLSLVG